MDYEIHTQWENYCLNVVEMKLEEFLNTKQEVFSKKLIENEGAYPLPNYELNE